MVKSGLGQWVLCVLMFMKAESSSMDDVDLTFINTAVPKGAVCLDGSPPAYQFDRGFGDGVHSWLVHIQGGGICMSVEDCLSRTNRSDGLGSSKLMKKLNFTGILSNKQAYNPNFYNWNRVLVRYCDGSCFTGDMEEVNPATNLHFRGARIFKVIVEELLIKGMKNARNALLSGCSAGGFATIINCDRFREFFPTSTRVKCAPDAGYFSHVKDLSGKYHFEEIVKQGFALHGSAKILPAACTSKLRTNLCFYPQYLMPYIRTPVFVVNSAYDTWQVENILSPKAADPHGSFTQCKTDLRRCSRSQLERLKEFGSDFLETSAVGERPCNGMFIDTCYAHCQTEDQPTWFGDPGSKLENKSIAEAVGDWFYDRNAFQKIVKKLVLPHYCAL